MKNTLDILDILFKSIPFIIAIYYFFVFIINSETEERQMYIYGYNRKSMNLFLTTYIIAWSMFPIIYTLFVEKNDCLTVLLSFNLNIILLFYIFYKKLNNRIFSIFSIFSIVMAIIIHLGIDNGIDSGIIANIITFFSINTSDITFFSIIFSIISIYLLKKENTASLNSNCEILYFVIVPLVFSNTLLHLYFITPKFFGYSILIILYISISIAIPLYLYPKFNKLNKKLFQISFDKTNSTNEKIGFIISETNDDIVFEIDGILHRYRKSDIFCIKEYQNPYASILETINNHLTHIKKIFKQISLYKFIHRIDIDIDKQIYETLKSIKDNNLNLNKMNDCHYDDILKIMEKDISNFKKNLSKIKKNLSKIKNDKKGKKYSYITNRLNSIEITKINEEITKIAKKKQELEQEKKKQEKEKEKQNQEPPTN